MVTVWARWRLVSSQSNLVGIRVKSKRAASSQSYGKLFSVRSCCRTYHERRMKALDRDLPQETEFYCYLGFCFALLPRYCQSSCIVITVAVGMRLQNRCNIWSSQEAHCWSYHNMCLHSLETCQLILGQLMWPIKTVLLLHDFMSNEFDNVLLNLHQVRSQLKNHQTILGHWSVQLLIDLWPNNLYCVQSERDL